MSSALKDLDEESIIIEWIEPWVTEANGFGWTQMAPQVRAVVCAWLLNVYSLRGGAISFLWYTPPKILQETTKGLQRLGENKLAALWRAAVHRVRYRTTTEQDRLEFSDEEAGEELDDEILRGNFQQRLLGWIQKHADALPSPPGWDIYLGAPPPNSTGNKEKIFGHALANTPRGLFVAGVKGPEEFSLLLDRFVLDNEPRRIERKILPLPRKNVDDIITHIELNPEGTHVVLTNQGGEIFMVELNKEPPEKILLASTGLAFRGLSVSSLGLVGYCHEKTSGEAMLFARSWSGSTLLAPGRCIITSWGERYISANEEGITCLGFAGRELWKSRDRFDLVCGPLGSGDLLALREGELFLLNEASGASRPLRALLPGLTPTKAPGHIEKVALSADDGCFAVVGRQSVIAWSLRSGVGREFPIRQPIHEIFFHGTTLCLVGNRSHLLSIDLKDTTREKLQYQRIEGWDYQGWDLTW